MRNDVSLDRRGWLCGLDYKKLIIVVFMLRLILASAYDIFITVTDKDILVPDSKFYSIGGRYIDLVLQGYDMSSFRDGYDVTSFAKGLVPGDRSSQAIFYAVLHGQRGRLPLITNEPTLYAYVIGIIYYILGYSTVWVRVFNIVLSILSAYLLFEVARRHFGDFAANIFLLTVLFLPTQFLYSVTLSRDFLRVFIVSSFIWLIYGGFLWKRS